MIKRFCDSCGAEITEANTAQLDGRSRLSAELHPRKRGGATLKVELIQFCDGTANSGDFCRHCIIDAFNVLDDRPRAALAKEPGRG